jgi:hypothetical protein
VYIEKRQKNIKLAKNDVQDNITITKITEKIERLTKNKVRYELLEEN